MKNKPEPSYTSLTYGSADEYPEILCPACKKKNILISEGVLDVDPCSHLACVRHMRFDGYSYESMDYYKRHQRRKKPVNNFDGFLEYLKYLGYGEEFFAYEVTFYGIACGPVEYTDIIGYDFNESKNEKISKKLLKKKFEEDEEREAERAFGWLLAHMTQEKINEDDPQ